MKMLIFVLCGLLFLFFLLVCTMLIVFREYLIILILPFMLICLSQKKKKFDIWCNKIF